jgi:hypothetical protein
MISLAAGGPASTSGADFAIDAARLRDFYNKTMAPALTHLYSVGTPVMAPALPHDSKRPIIVLLSSATDEEIEGLAAANGDAVHFTARSPERTVHFADNLIFIVGSGHEGLDEKLAGEYVFFREYEHKLGHFLDMHRSVWEAIEAMRSKDDVKLGDLPGVRDRLLDYDRDLTVLGARLGQMDAYLDERQSQIDDLGLAKTMVALEAYRYGKMRIATKYMDQLLEMLDDYISSTVEITGLMYQENLQKEINFQQFVFLLGSVAAIIMLGTLPSSKMAFFDPAGKLISNGKLFNFEVKSLAIFGGCAFIATLIIFSVIRPLISSFKRIRVTSLLGSGGSQKTAPVDPDIRPDSL